MATHDFKNFFLYFYMWFINISGMKVNGLVVCCISFMCTIAYGAEVVVSNPGQLSSVGPGVDIIINNGGVYSLQNLDSINANGITMDFAMAGGGTNPSMVLSVDSGFDGILATPLINNIDNLQIKLTDAFLNGVTSDEILRFSNFTTSAGFINVFPENTSDTYAYHLVVCPDGMGWCVMRTSSETYIAAQQSALYAEQVVSVGVQNNPDILLQPMITINQYELLGYYNFSDESFISIAPEYYNSKDFQNVGIHLNSGTKIGGSLYIGLSAYAIKTDFKNDVSDFKSDVYGGNLRFNYDLNELLFVRGIGGISFSSIDCDGVVKGNTTVNNPNAYGIYGGLDFGAKFNIESGLYLSPFVGYDMRSEHIVDIYQHDSFVHFGNDIGFRYFMDGVSYDYILRTGINSHGYLDATVGISIGSVSDKIGGTLSFGVLDTDFGWSGKISADIKFVF